MPRAEVAATLAYTPLESDADRSTRKHHLSDAAN